MKNRFLVIIIFLGLPIAVALIIYNSIFKSSTQSNSSTSTLNSASKNTNQQDAITSRNAQSSSARSVKSTKVS